MGLLVSGAVVFGVQTLVPAQDNTWLRREVKLPGCAPTDLNPEGRGGGVLPHDMP